MKSNDVPIGAGLLVLALLILWHVSTFPPAPGQPYNAALFPGIAAAGLAIAAIVLMITGVRKRRDERQSAAAEAAAAAELQALTGSADVEILETTPVPSRLLAILLTAGAIGFYLLAGNFLGFIITGWIILAVLMWSFGVAFKVLLPVSTIAVLVIHFAFYKLLSVPLPWGLLQPIAW